MNKLEKLENENNKLRTEIRADFEEQCDITSQHLDATANTVLEFKHEINNCMSKLEDQIKAWEEDYQAPEEANGSTTGLLKNKTVINSINKPENMSKDYISQVVQEELSKRSTNGNEKIQIEVTNRESAFGRDYKLTPSRTWILLWIT